MEVDVITLQELFKFQVEQITADRVVVGSLRATGLRPTFLEKFEKRGVTLPVGLFRDEFPLHFSAERGVVSQGAPAWPDRGRAGGSRPEAPPRRRRPG